MNGTDGPTSAGLIHCKCCRGRLAWKGQYFLDSMSNPDEWQIGFEIVYRIDSRSANDPGSDYCKQAVMKAFGLSRDHYRFEDTLWRVYWDKGSLDLGLLKRCEKLMDTAARDNDVVLMLHLSAIQPRSIRYLEQRVLMNQ